MWLCRRHRGIADLGACIADRALPRLQASAGREACPALYPVALAAVLVSAKNHEHSPPLISTLLESAVRCSGFAQMLVSCGSSAVLDAELWLVSTCRLVALRPLTDDIVELIEKLRCAFRVRQRGSGARTNARHREHRATF